MELRGLFQYLVNQLKKGQGIELVLLQVRFHSKVYGIVENVCHLLMDFMIISGAYSTNGQCPVHRKPN